MDLLEKTLTDVYMPEDLCARCAEEEPSTKYCLLLTPSPSSTFKPTKVFFCSEDCLDRFVVGWESLKESGSGV